MSEMRNINKMGVTDFVWRENARKNTPNLKKNKAKGQ